MFKKLSSVFPPIRQHQFFLHDFNTLYPRLKRVEILTSNVNTCISVSAYVCVCARMI